MTDMELLILIVLALGAYVWALTELPAVTMRRRERDEDEP